MYRYNAIVTNVVDGDTVDLSVDVGFYIKTNIRARLLGVNTPETRGEEKYAGMLAKGYVYSKLQNKEVVIETYKSDSFGRWLVTIYLDGENFNEKLIKEGIAQLYYK